MNFRKTLYALSITTLIGFLSSCGPVDPCGTDAKDFVKKNTTFFENVKKESYAFTEDNWKEKDKQLQQAIKDCLPKYKSDLSINEYRVFWTDVVGYYSNRYGVAKMALEMAKDGDIMKELRQNIKELDIDWKAIFKKNNKVE